MASIVDRRAQLPAELADIDKRYRPQVDELINLLAAATTKEEQRQLRARRRAVEREYQREKLMARVAAYNPMVW